MHFVQLTADKCTGQRFCGVQRLAWLKSLVSTWGGGERTAARAESSGRCGTAARLHDPAGERLVMGHGAVAQAHRAPLARLLRVKGRSVDSVRGWERCLRELAIPARAPGAVWGPEPGLGEPRAG